MRRGIGIIGTGKHGSRYAEHLVRDLTDRAELTAICRRSPAIGKEQADRWQAAYHQDWRQLVADPRVEAVISVTTPNLNPEIAACCLNHQKPLLIEKPLAVSVPVAQAMVAGFQAAGLPLTVAQTLRYNQVILGLRREFPRIGELRCLSATHQLEPSTLDWLTRPELAGGGVIFHTAVHVFDALRFITGQEIVRIQATARRVHNPNLEDLLAAQFELSGGALGTLLAGKVGAARAGRYEFMGEAGQLQGDQVHGQLELVQGAEVTAFKHERPGPTILPLLRDWLDYLAGLGENPLPGQEGWAAVRVCAACDRAARTGGWVACL
ncbi:MAG: Gfo/Idh/MocA family oxidoreductase [Desulfobacteraceae bacterium]|nr:Gfo/Idh/MocA family oxidoreductase [Desulfobacteraceae bacterium]